MAAITIISGTVTATAVISKGDTGIRELPDSGVITAGDQLRKTLKYAGTLSALAAVQPLRGDTVTGHSGYEVESSVLTPGKGNMAEMQVNLVATSASFITPAVIRDKYDVDWMRIERPIETSPYLGDAAAQAAAAIVLDLWRNGEPALRAQYKYIDAAGVEQTLADKVLDIAKKIMKGVESYLVFTPVVQRVRAYRGRPTTGGCGVPENPPANTIAGYVFLKTADRLSDQDESISIRTEEWTGALEWDADLYPEAEA